MGAEAFADLLRRLTPWVHLIEEPADPFEALEVQSRLTRLAAEIEVLDRAATVGSRGYAPAFHLRAALIAYETCLRDACRLAGFPMDVQGTGDRLLAEVRLREAGWVW